MKKEETRKWNEVFDSREKEATWHSHNQCHPPLSLSLPFYQTSQRQNTPNPSRAHHPKNFNGLEAISHSS